MKNKAKELVAKLLGENDENDDSLISGVLYGDPFGEYLKVLSLEGPDDDEPFIVAKHSRGQQYLYVTGYDGGTSYTEDVVIESVIPLREFDDFYGKTSKYPVIAKISEALDKAGIRNTMGGPFLEGRGAGSLSKIHGAGKLERKG